jgi:hypothetical protein
MAGSSPKIVGPRRARIDSPERPTQRSFEALRLAEEESRLARAAALAELDDLDLDDPVEALLASRQAREPDPFSMAPPRPAEAPDQFGGLLPVMTEPPPAVRGPRVPRVLLSRAEIAELPIDPRSAFVLCHIDGSQTLEEILDVCAMPESDALAQLGRLQTMGVIAI